MTRIYYSDLAVIPLTVCMSSLDENLKPLTDTTAHVWDDDTNPATCAECGTEKDKDNSVTPK